MRPKRRSAPRGSETALAGLERAGRDRRSVVAARVAEAAQVTAQVMAQVTAQVTAHALRGVRFPREPSAAANLPSSSASSRTPAGAPLCGR